MEKIYKTFKVDLAKEIKTDEGTGSAKIATLNVIDHDGEVIVPGAFGEQHVNVMPAHERTAPRLGKAILKEADNIAIADFKFNLDKDAITAREWFSSLKFDANNGEPLQEWSFGFDVIDAENGEFEGKSVRFLKSLRVFEISPVLRGAGIDTGTLSIKEKKNQTFKEEMEKALTSLGDVKAIIERTKSLAVLRAEKGQGLSNEKQDQLKSIDKTLVELSEDCKAILFKVNENANVAERLETEYQRIVLQNRHLMRG